MKYFISISAAAVLLCVGFVVGIKFDSKWTTTNEGNLSFYRQKYEACQAESKMLYEDYNKCAGDLRYTMSRIGLKHSIKFYCAERE